MKLYDAIEKYQAYLVIEKSLSENSISAYLADVKKFITYCTETAGIDDPDQVTGTIINDFLNQSPNLNDRTQARIISTLRSFFKYLVKDGYLETDPTGIINAPKVVRKPPIILTVEEINAIKKAVEMFKPEAQRNKAIIEMLYSCGLRVSELTGIKLSNINYRAGTVKVEGEGNKERILELTPTAKQEIKLYLKNYRDYLDIQKGCEDILFLNKRGTTLSRVMVFNIIKHLADRAGIRKTISPHTFRHSFAAHLIDKGVDLQTVRNLLGHESILTTEIYTK